MAVLSSYPSMMTKQLSISQSIITSTVPMEPYNRLYWLKWAKYILNPHDSTMNFDVFSQHVGFEHYYGRTEYDNDADSDNKWGIFDGPFLQYFANNLDTVSQPFAAIAYTLSSHHPFTLPTGFVLP